MCPGVLMKRHTSRGPPGSRLKLLGVHLSVFLASKDRSTVCNCIALLLAMVNVQEMTAVWPVADPNKEDG